MSYEVALISPDGPAQMELGLDEDVRSVHLLVDRRAVVSYSAADAGEVYSIGARRGGGLRIVGDALLPYWPCWPHRGDRYPEFEAFFWRTEWDAWAVSIHLQDREIDHPTGTLLGMGVGFGPESTARPTLLVNLGADTQQELLAAIDGLGDLSLWDGDVVAQSLVAAPAIT